MQTLHFQILSGLSWTLHLPHDHFAICSCHIYRKSGKWGDSRRHGAIHQNRGVIDGIFTHYSLRLLQVSSVLWWMHPFTFQTRRVEDYSRLRRLIDYYRLDKLPSLRRILADMVCVVDYRYSSRTGKQINVRWKWRMCVCEIAVARFLTAPLLSQKPT
jgi:hypothetical protein